MTTPPLTDRITVEHLDRYLRGTATPGERAQVRAWMQAHPDAHDFVERMTRPPANADLETAWTQVERLITTGEESDERKKGLVEKSPASTARERTFDRRNTRLTQPRSLGRTGLTAALTLSAVIAIYFGIRPSTSSSGAEDRYTTGSGQRTTVRLPDGTRVTLAPQSQLVLAPGFGRTNRTLRLTGQAYFEAIATPKRPLIVATGNVTSRVLGTVFTVRHYATDRDVVVAVQSGKVAAGREKFVVLTENSVARLTDSTTQLSTNADLRDYMEWTSGRLVFTGVSAAEITTVLGRWYGLTFEFADSTMVDQVLTGTFDDHESRENVLANLQLLLGAQMTFKDNVVTLTRKRAVARPRLQPQVNPTRTEVGR